MVLRRILWLIRTSLRFLIVLCNNLISVPVYFGNVLLVSPLFCVKPSIFWEVEGEIFKLLNFVVGSWCWSAGYKYYEVGEDVSSCFDQECLVMSNHQSMADVPTLMTTFFHKNKVIPRMLWIMDHILKFSHFGLVSWFRGDFFIRQGRKDSRNNELDHLKSHVLNTCSSIKRQWIFLFPEGGFLSKRLESSQRYAKQNNLPVLKHVTLPRIGAFHTIVKTLHPLTLNRLSCTGTKEKNLQPLRWIIDITIGYPKGKPVDLGSLMLMLGKPCNVFTHYRRFPIQEVPTDSTELTKWLYDRFSEKEHLLDEFYRTDSFPASFSRHGEHLTTAKEVSCATHWIVIYNIGLIATALLQYSLLSWVLSCLWPF